MLAEVNKILEAFALNVVSAAKDNLAKSGNSNGDLYNSLDYKIPGNNNEIEINFIGTNYANFYDLGVQGAAPSKMPPNSISRYNKAPMSPYKFGSGSGKKGGLRGAIDKWVVRKPGLSNVRDNLGRFIPRKSMVFLITRSIYLTGLKPSYFFDKPLKKYLKQLEIELEEALGRDIEIALSESKEPTEITVTIPN
tara:strand:- start:47 stop:628 length:582 start_codon:yes stop_codon:yes gene_type:complete